MDEEKMMNGIDLPDHSNQLNYAETVINKYKKRLTYQKSIRALSKDDYVELHKLLVKVLEYVGDLSMSAFNVQELLEENYFRLYKNSPELARKLFQDRYHELHRPYNTLKNRCFTLLDLLEESYYKINGLQPPKEF